MLDRGNPYYRQVELLVRVLPLVAKIDGFALKGGTALNLFMQDLPRLSVDIDLVYLPLEERSVALSAITRGLGDLSQRIGGVHRGARVTMVPGDQGECQRLQVRYGDAQIKIEVSPVMRGSVLPPQVLPVRAAVEEAFGYVEANVLDRDELYAGKLVAALDRQHPRDLFDIKMLFDGEGIAERLVDLFVIYLASSNRPMAELLSPNPLPLPRVFEQQFQGMALVPVTCEELEFTRRYLFDHVVGWLSDEQKRFLLSFKAGEPEWEHLAYPDAQELPAVQWKLQNIRRLPSGKRDAAFAKLAAVLSDQSA
jgi:hypothetical protein